jgi:uncharacterized protein (DUF1330 family)
VIAHLKTPVPFGLGQEIIMTAFAFAVLRNVSFGPDIVKYVEQIDSTLAPFDGRFVVHGGDKTVLEGSFAGDLIAISFPSRERALAWYESAAYRAILPLRTANSDGDVVLVDGVSGDHRATDILA